MISPIEALQKLRDEAVMTRRRLVDQGQSVQSVQAEIEAIDRALIDERSLRQLAEGGASTQSKAQPARPGFGEPSDADEA